MSLHSSVIIVASPRPRVGKTLLARLLIDYQLHNGRPVAGFDLNGDNNALAQFLPEAKKCRGGCRAPGKKAAQLEDPVRGAADEHLACGQITAKARARRERRGEQEGAAGKPVEEFEVAHMAFGIFLRGSGVPAFVELPPGVSRKGVGVRRERQARQFGRIFRAKRPADAS